MNQLSLNPEFHFHPRCKRLGVIHICFADDLLKFYRDDMQSVKLLNKTFKLFSDASGLQANILGVPLSTKKLTISQCLPLVEKITSKISCWSARMLSYAGRHQLIKSVLFSIQTYWSQIFILPKKIIKLIKAIYRSFLRTGVGQICKKALKKDSLWIRWIHYFNIKIRDLETMQTPKTAVWVVKKIIDSRNTILKMHSLQGTLIQNLEAM
ncbi:uncharacterized protein LOC132637300 [Lycium barbarum]|uniref:uncharacterized protein LOC132637300 n=1 Tax=Lycium barbarum TaxID=112863 RepID=UPI00293EEC30|nr:uncharacterized protein LOC132637300 [Lycium barbarum]